MNVKIVILYESFEKGDFLRAGLLRLEYITIFIKEKLDDLISNGKF